MDLILWMATIVRQRTVLFVYINDLSFRGEQRVGENGHSLFQQGTYLTVTGGIMADNEFLHVGGPGYLSPP